MFNFSAAAFNLTTFTGYNLGMAAEDPAALARRYRRTRTIFSRAQRDVMEGIFKRTHFPDYTQRQLMADQFSLDERRIQVWFKNRRSKFRQQEKMTPAQEMKCEEAAQAAALLAQGHNFVTTTGGGIFKLADGNPAPPALGGTPPVFHGGDSPPTLAGLGHFSSSLHSLAPAGPPATSAVDLQGGFPAHLSTYFQQPPPQQLQQLQQPQLPQPQLEEEKSNQDEETPQQQPGSQTDLHPHI